MVLLVGGVGVEEVPGDSHTLVSNHPFLRDAAAHLLSIPTKVIGPLGLLYVGQREMAVTIPHDKNVNIIGTDDLTACIMFILRNTTTGAVGVAHYDGCGTDEGVTAMVQRMQELSYPETRLQLQMVGGFSDSCHYSEELFFNLMHAFQKQPIEIDLTMACVGELNTTVRNGRQWPILFGAGVNVKTGEIFPATFPDKGPEQALRKARNLVGAKQVSNFRIFKIVWSFPRVHLSHFRKLLISGMGTMFDLEFIKPPHIVMQIRTTLKYIQENPFPDITVFHDNRPHYFRRDEHTGLWVPFRY
ncbi:protein N-terminal asparagine amidohydrolase [Nilaparvata lugens]|uniref:protein N-terminal asparagine amidohydrolase n=1 Tax=Nilaparvata lugens TaxID=108931 RepID=UPI00193DC1A1|nr:protein N-terminal asparagine amidohydrolase [Nilaparvata lugens]